MKVGKLRDSSTSCLAQESGIEAGTGGSLKFLRERAQMVVIADIQNFYHG